MKSLILSAAVSLTALTMPVLALADDDVAAGEKVFKRCVALPHCR